MLERHDGAEKVVLGWRSRVCWGRKAEPERIGQRKEAAADATDICGSGAAKVRLRWRSRACWKDVAAAKVRLRWRSRACWKDMTEPKRWMANISCQKENKSLETIVFSAETNVLRKRLKHTKK